MKIGDHVVWQAKDRPARAGVVLALRKPGEALIELGPSKGWLLVPPYQIVPLGELELAEPGLADDKNPPFVLDECGQDVLFEK